MELRHHQVGEGDVKVRAIDWRLEAVLKFGSFDDWMSVVEPGGDVKPTS